MFKLNYLFLRNIQNKLFYNFKVKNGFSLIKTNERCIQTNRNPYARAVKPARKFIKGLIVIELGIFLGCYFVWKQMNRSQDFRYYMSKNYPAILDGSLFLNYYTCLIQRIRTLIRA